MQEAIKKVTDTSSANKDESVRTVKAMMTESECEGLGKPVDAIRQGDIYITRLDELPGGLKPAKTNQLAPGNTQGSRHVVRADAGVVVYERQGDALTGPVISAPEGCHIEHPEHGDIAIKCGGVYGVTYQRAHAEELRRVAD